MTPSNEPNTRQEQPVAKDGGLDDTGLPPAERTDLAEQQRLWRQYRLQQQRRSCPGCGDDDTFF